MDEKTLKQIVRRLRSVVLSKGTISSDAQCIVIWQELKKICSENKLNWEELWN